MSTPTTRRVHIYINSGQAEKRLQGLQKQSQKLEKDIRSGKLEGKALADAMAELGKKKRDIEQLEAVIGGKMTASVRDVRKYVRDLKRELESMSHDAPEYARKFEEFKKASAHLKEVESRVKGVGKATQGFFKKFMRNAATIGAGVLIGNTVDAALSKFQQYVSGLTSGNAKLADSMADIEKSTGLSAESVQELVSGIHKLDTRTKNSQLREIAVALGQLGEPATVKGIQNIDRLVVALGDEYDGGAEEITKDISILRNNLQDFKTGDYGEDVLHLGNALNVLGAEGLATAPVVTDIANRIAGIAGTFGVTSGQILGTAATFQELGIKSERGSTAFIRILQRMTRNVGAYAKIAEHAGISQKDFVDLVNTDAVAALMKVAEGAKIAGNSNVAFSRILKDLEADGSGAGEVLSKLAVNSELYRSKIDLATKSLTENNSITEEFDKKNNNLAATMEKLGKWANRLFINSKIMDGIGKFFNWFAKGVGAIDDTKDAMDAFHKQVEKIRGLELNVDPLIERIEDLKGKSELNNDEQRELKETIDAVAKAIPTAISEFDKYGNALDVNTDKAKEYIRVQKLIAQEKHRDAIKDLEERLQKLQKNAKTLNNQLNMRDAEGDLYRMLSPRSGEGFAGESIAVKLTNEEIAALQKQLAEYTERIRGIKGYIAELRGEDPLSGDKTNKPAFTLLPSVTGIPGPWAPNRTPIKTTTSDEEDTTTSGGGDYAVSEKEEKKAKRLREHRKQLLEEYEALQAEVNTLGEEGTAALDAEHDKQRQQIEAKYRKLTEKAEEYLVELSGINELKQEEINAAVKKYKEERDSIEYEEGLKTLKEYYAEKERVILNKLAKGAMTEKEYQAEHERLEEQHLENRIQLADNYADTVEKAEKEAQEGRTEQLKDGIEERRKLTEKANREEMFSVNLRVITARKGSKEEKEARLAALKEQFEQETAHLDKSSQEYLYKFTEYEEKKKKIEQDFVADKIAAFGGYLNQMADLYQSFVDMRRKAIEETLRQELHAIDKEQNRYKTMLDEKQISEETYNKKTEELNEKKRQKEYKAQKALFEHEKKLSLMRLAAQEAEAISKVWSMWGHQPWYAVGLALAAAATIGIQMATVAGQTFPEYEQFEKGRRPRKGKGGVPDGQSHANGGIKLVDAVTGQIVGEMEGDEPILSKDTYLNNKRVVDMLLDSSMHRGGEKIPDHLFAMPRRINVSAANRALERRRLQQGGYAGDNNAAGTGSYYPNSASTVVYDAEMKEMMNRLISVLDNGIKAEVYQTDLEAKAKRLQHIRGQSRMHTERK